LKRVLDATIYVFLDPWEHVVGMGLGAVFVNQLVKWDEKLKEDLDKMLERAKQANERRYFGSCLIPLTFFLNSDYSFFDSAFCYYYCPHATYRFSIAT
jgi:hypothetical protein